MMIGIFALVKKELQSFFSRPVVYLLLGLCTSIIGLVFTVSLHGFVRRSLELSAKVQQSGLNLHEQLIQGYLGVVHYVFLLFICFLSVSFFTEEKKQGTMKLLLSSPLTSWELVLGKFVSGALLIFFMCGVASLFPLGLAFYVDFQWMSYGIAIFGLFSVLSVYLALAMSVSALTSSSLLAPFLSFVVAVSMLLVSTGQYLVQSSEARQFFSYLSFEKHFGLFRVGSLSFTSFLFFATLIAFFLVLCERVVESHRWS